MIFIAIIALTLVASSTNLAFCLRGPRGLAFLNSQECYHFLVCDRHHNRFLYGLDMFECIFYCFSWFHDSHVTAGLQKSTILRIPSQIMNKVKKNADLHQCLLWQRRKQRNGSDTLVYFGHFWRLLFLNSFWLLSPILQASFLLMHPWGNAPKYPPKPTKENTYYRHTVRRLLGTSRLEYSLFEFVSYYLISSWYLLIQYFVFDIWCESTYRYIYIYMYTYNLISNIRYTLYITFWVEANIQPKMFVAFPPQ